MAIQFINEFTKKDIKHVVTELLDRLEAIQAEEEKEYNKKYFNTSYKDLCSPDAIARAKSKNHLSNSIFSITNGLSHLETSIKTTEANV